MCVGAGALGPVAAPIGVLLPEAPAEPPIDLTDPGDEAGSVQDTPLTVGTYPLMHTVHESTGRIRSA
jgi:hypothetical protein